MSDHAVVFAPSGRRGEFAPGTTVLDAARALGVDLDSVCGGRGICGRCTIVPDRDLPVGAVEAALRARRPIADDRRLACCVDVEAVGRVLVPDDARLHRPVVRKDRAAVASDRPLALDPAVTLHYLTFDGGATERLDADVPTDSARLRSALTAQWSIDATPTLAALIGLRACRAGTDVTVAVSDAAIVAVWSGFVDAVHGVAIDVGSTTIAAQLIDLTTGDERAAAGTMNPQIRFGDDVMSRVSYVMMDPSPPARAVELTTVLRAELDRLVGEVLTAAGATRDSVVEVTVVANPIMHHLLLGLDPRPLGVAPFALAVADALDVDARELDLDLPHAALHVLPCIAGHVGADATAVVLADRPDERPGASLVVDIGTNAELVLAVDGALWAASSPTGPAFEGAQISCGQRAAVGAIERVRIDPTTLEPRVRVIGCDAWSDEPGFAAAPTITGVCGSGIVEVLGELVRARVIEPDGTISGAAAARSARVVADERTFAYVLCEEPRLTITQGDVRAIQLAKAALVAGGRLLMERAGVERLDRVALAGAFGSHLDPDYARAIELVPLAGEPVIESIGNAAGEGARRALLSREERATATRLATAITKIETATEPSFQSHFVTGLAFPGEPSAPRRRRGRARVATNPEETA